MNKKDICIKLGLLNKDGSSIEGKVFDYALPQNWIDDVARLNDSYHPEWFVWLYDDTMWGRPYALCDEGWDQIEKYNQVRGTNYKIERIKVMKVYNEVIVKSFPISVDDDQEDIQLSIRRAYEYLLEDGYSIGAAFINTLNGSKPQIWIIFQRMKKG